MIFIDVPNKTDDEVINLLILTAEVSAVNYYRMQLDEAYRKKQVVWSLKEELRSRLSRRIIDKKELHK